MWHFQLENIGDGVGLVVLHHAFLKLPDASYAFARDDERLLHFGQCDAPVSVTRSVMVGCKDDHLLIPHASLTDGVELLAYIIVQLFQFSVIGRRVVPIGVPCMNQINGETGASKMIFSWLCLTSW